MNSGFARNLKDLQGREFDCIVIGGGIHGASLLLEASRLGHRALLVERADFGRGASAGSFRILHGGLRYLQSLDISRFRESVRARRWFLRHFPELTAARGFALPLEGGGVHHPVVFRGAFALDALLARDRNDGVVPSHHLPRGRVLPRHEVGQILGNVDVPTGRDVAYWFDGWIAEPQRLLVEMLRWSGALGATVINHTEPVRPISDNGRLRGFVLRRDGEEFEVIAPFALAATGSWTPSLLAAWGLPWEEEMPTARAFNVVLEGDLGSGAVALGVRARGGRNAFLWSDRGLTHVGTVHRNDGRSPDETRVPLEEVREFLTAIDDRVPSLDLGSRRVVAVTCGRLLARSTEDPEMPHRDRIFDLGRRGGPAGLHVVVGLKYTTAPEVAARVASSVLGGAASALPNSRSPKVPGPTQAQHRSLDGPASPGPESRGPIRITDLIRAWDERPDEVRSLVETLRVEEGAVALADLVLGRMDGGEDPGVARELAARLAPVLFPDPAVRSEELAGLERILESQLPVG